MNLFQNLENKLQMWHGSNYKLQEWKYIHVVIQHTTLDYYVDLLPFLSFVITSVSPVIELPVLDVMQPPISQLVAAYRQLHHVQDWQFNYWCQTDN